MIFQANLKEAVRSLQSAKQRTLLALIGIVIGIGSVIAMVSVGSIVQLESMRQFKELGTDIISLEKEVRADMSRRQAAMSSGFKLSEVQAIAQHCPGVRLVAPSTQGGGGNAFYKGKPIERNHFLGATASFADLNKLRVQEGRFLNDLDVHSRFVVIGASIAEAMRGAGAEKVLGESLRIGDQIYTVVGVLAPMPQSGARRFDPNVVVLSHITTALRQPEVEIALVSIRVQPGTSNTAAGEQVLQYFSRYPDGAGVQVSSPEDLIAQMEKQMQMFTLLLGAIGGISLVVGGVGVMNVMLVSVSERRREIGIRRALGAKRGDIRQQFLIESVILSLIGGFLGIVLGVLAARVISHFAHWQYVMAWGPVALGVGVSTAVGLFFGFYPARQAAMLDPIVALRSD